MFDVLLFLTGNVAQAANQSSDAVALVIVPILFGFMSLYMIIPLFIFGVMTCLIIFWIMMLVDCVKRDFKKENDKIMWILIVVLASWVGAIIYYFMIKRENKH